MLKKMFFSKLVWFTVLVVVVGACFIALLVQKVYSEKSLYTGTIQAKYEGMNYGSKSLMGPAGTLEELDTLVKNRGRKIYSVIVQGKIFNLSKTDYDNFSIGESVSIRNGLIDGADSKIKRSSP